ncbi:MAG: ABC transporter transmembrane domain-containing protein, partial [Candidatus Omnitrophota bacterium]
MEDRILLLEATGFSMHPFVKNRDKIVVKEARPEDLKVGDIILYREELSGKTVCHRLVKKAMPEGRPVLYTRGDTAASEAAVPADRLIGRVIEIIRGDRTLRMNSPQRIVINWFIAKFYGYARPALVRCKDLSRFIVFLRPYWKIKLLAFCMKGLLIPLGLAIPYLTKLMIDRAYGNKDLELFIRLALAGAGIFSASIIIEGLSGYLDGKLNFKLNFDLTSRVFRHLQSLPLKFFQDRSSAGHIFSLNFDVDRITGLLNDTLPQFIYLGGRFLLTAALLFYLNWKMAVLCMGLAPLLLLQPLYFTKERRKAFSREIYYSESLLNRMIETLSHIHLVKALGTEKKEIQNFLDSLRRKMDLSLWQAKLGLYDFFAGSSLRKLILGV